MSLSGPAPADQTHNAGTDTRDVGSRSVSGAR